MAREKKPVHRVQMTEGKRNIIHQLLEEYDIQSAEDIQDALKDLLGGTIKEMMEAEMDDHLGYEKSERSDSDDYRNGYKRKRVNSRYGSMEIEVPQDRKSTFEPQVVKKRQKDISDIDQKIISMYAKGMTTRQISETIEDIYGFETSEGFISDVTDKILPQIEDWQNRPLDEVYPILYIDAIHYSVRDNGVIRKLAAYVILGINAEGKKEVLTIRIGENESSKYWLSVLNELKNRGVKDILIICADGLTGIKEAIAAAFPKTEYQRCIVHQVRNTLKYVPDKDRKAFAADLKTIYQAADEKKALAALDRVTEKWTPKYPNSMKRWKDNWDAISPIFKFSATVRKVIYTAYGYVDEAEKLDYGAEEVVPMMYNYQKRDIAEKFGIVENTNRVVEEQPVDASEPILEDEAYDIRESEYGTYEVSDETDKREFDVEECDMFEAITNISETAINETVDVEELNVHINATAEQTIEQRAEEIVDVVRKSYTSYDRLSIMDKARIFEFRIDDNRYNLQLHGLVLKKLGLNLYGAEVYEDYQSIYEETMKKAERQNSGDGRRYGGKKWERGR